MSWKVRAQRTLVPFFVEMLTEAEREWDSQVEPYQQHVERVIAEAEEENKRHSDRIMHASFLLRERFGNFLEEAGNE